MFHYFNPVPNNPFFTTLRWKPFENILGKRGNAGNQHVLLFTQSFLLHWKQISIFLLSLFQCQQVLSNWTGLKIICVVQS